MSFLQGIQIDTLKHTRRGNLDGCRFSGLILHVLYFTIYVLSRPYIVASCHVGIYYLCVVVSGGYIPLRLYD